jgi:hypothetical protein
MKPEVNSKSNDTRGNCIGCRDCKGLCQALLELAFLPETVLKSAPAAR